MAVTNQIRTILGPLTTTYTPAPSCTDAVIGVAQCQDCSAWRGQTCLIPSSSGAPYIVQDDRNCWPPRSAGALTVVQPFEGWGFYSPGVVCPSGMTTACSATAGSFSNWSVQYEMVAGETAVGCCPSGFICSDAGFAQTCVLVATSTTVQVSICASPTGFTKIGLPYTVDASATVSAQTVYAPMIQINWQSSDIPNTSSKSSSQSVTSSPTASSTPQVETKGSGLSTGAKAGIGIGAALGVIAVVIAAWLIYRRGKHSKKVPPTKGPVYELNAGPVPHSAAELAQPGQHDETKPHDTPGLPNNHEANRAESPHELA